VPRTVAVLAFEGISPFHLSVPSLVLGDDPADARTASHEPPWPWRLVVCATTPGTLTTNAGFGIVVEHGLEALDTADVVVVPWWGDPTAPAPATVLDALRRAHVSGATIVGLCLGAFVLAEAGVLDGLRATTHWRWADAFRDRFPAVELDASALYVDEGSVLTGAGASAGIDTCLHLLADRHGRAVANRVARRIVAAPHRVGGQAQFVEQPVLLDASDDDAVGRACAWATAYLGEPLSIDALAAVAHLSRSSFTRAFRARTGSSVSAWVARQRVALVRDLLEATDCPVETVATTAGFGGAAVMREHFRQELGVTPARYRAAFRSGTELHP
jgi:transcriptional regulator GlxA family with amidase domain